LEVLITKLSPTKWEWRVCDRYGTILLGGFESTRPAAKYKGYRALFHLWLLPRTGDRTGGITYRTYLGGRTLSQSEVGISETDKLNEMVQLLASLYEAAQRLPDASERQEALRQIGGFQRRMATFIRRLGSEAQAIL